MKNPPHFYAVTFGHSIDYCPVKEKFVNHIHSDYECYLFIRGDAEFVVENELFPLGSNDLLLISPGRYHFVNILSELPYERYVMNFDINLVPLPLRVKMPVSDNCLKVNIDDAYMIQRFAKMREYVQSYDNETADILCKTLISELLAYIYNRSPHPATGAKDVDPLISKVISYINDNIGARLSLEILSGEMFVSRSLLSHRFSQTMNIGLMEYVKMKKVYFAQTLLLNGEKPCDVWQQCGFSDYATFFRSYKKVIGASPSTTKKV